MLKKIFPDQSLINERMVTCLTLSHSPSECMPISLLLLLVLLMVLRIHSSIWVSAQSLDPCFFISWVSLWCGCLGSHALAGSAGVINASHTFLTLFLVSLVSLIVLAFFIKLCLAMAFLFLIQQLSCHLTWVCETAFSWYQLVSLDWWMTVNKVVFMYSPQAH